MVAQVEDAVIARVAGAAGLGYKFGTVASYAGELDGQLDEVVRKWPACWITWTGSAKPTRFGTSRTRWVEANTFAVLVAARNVRGERETRHGSVSEPGAYQMLDDVQSLLIGQDFGIAIEAFEPGRKRTLYNAQLRGKSIAVYAQEWHTRWLVEKPAEEIVGGLLKVGINYHLTPDDGTADASDLITLEGSQ
ncbi:DUF1834 family protein [Denitromonas halophila]|uniref:DUF1834 family protein n=1 Tax=Denitromonas halophila TaxID=1629404 RepID=A0A557QX91_9RHOO|nr:DUF1834 family protein [Denitromonas halophila]TVO57527.1 DUF1834 family protein [Denitromonas halophila]